MEPDFYPGYQRNTAIARVADDSVTLAVNPVGEKKIKSSWIEQKVSVSELK